LAAWQDNVEDGFIAVASFAAAIEDTLSFGLTHWARPRTPYVWETSDGYKLGVGVATIASAGLTGPATALESELGGVAAVQSGVRASGAVAAYDVGPANVLRARSVPGDLLDIHHVGQAHAMELLVPGYSRATGPAIAVPEAEHAMIPALRGPVGLSPRGVLAKDIWDLRNFTHAPNSALRALIDLNKLLFPGSF
jgi:hypothetical protein